MTEMDFLKNEINWWPLKGQNRYSFLKLIASGEKNHEAVVQLILGRLLG